MTQHYVGTKIVMAWEQAHADGREGFTVKYQDGYTSWCPRAQFEESNVAIGHVGHLPPHQQRVIAEKAQLDDRLTKLRAFLGGNAREIVDASEFRRMSLQADAMDVYSKVLGERIEVFASQSHTGPAGTPAPQPTEKNATRERQ